MLKKDLLKIHQERHELLLKEAKQRYGSSESVQYSEAVWENTLSELTAGEYDTVIGLRVFVAELLARNERQAFIDTAATRLCQIARSGNDTSEATLKNYARVAYQQAEALWRERQDRRNRSSDAEIPF